MRRACYRLYDAVPKSTHLRILSEENVQIATAERLEFTHSQRLHASSSDAAHDAPNLAKVRAFLDDNDQLLAVVDSSLAFGQEEHFIGLGALLANEVVFLIHHRLKHCDDVSHKLRNLS